MQEHQMYITPENAVETVLKNLPSKSRLIVTGQIGCGKTTLARVISAHLALTHLEIDRFSDDPDPMISVSEAVRKINGGWVAEANVWQIPQSIWESANFILFLDYANWRHYLGIIHRCYKKCLKAKTWTTIKHTAGEALLHLKIIFLYANKNRRGWYEQGGITNTTTPVIRCSSRSETDKLVLYIKKASRI